MQELIEALALEGFGFEGCAHAQPSGGKRQVLLVDIETLDAMKLAPGAIRENITTQGLNVNSLKVGYRLRAGTALLEVSSVCTPCDQMERIRPGLRRELWGRRGMMCRVIRSGMVRRGDPIQQLPSAEAESDRARISKAG
jgi:MOSC domain-containing protein YiiM